MHLTAAVMHHVLVKWERQIVLSDRRKRLFSSSSVLFIVSTHRCKFKDTQTEKTSSEVWSSPRYKNASSSRPPSFAAPFQPRYRDVTYPDHHTGPSVACLYEATLICYQRTLHVWRVHRRSIRHAVRVARARKQKHRHAHAHCQALLP